MKQKVLFFAFLVCIISINAQAPNKFNYQAVVRNSAGNPIAQGSNVAFLISIIDNSASGTVLYSERHTATTTNALGIVNLEIGSGTVITGTWPTANQWATNSKFIKVSIDPVGGSSYQDVSTTQLLSVPFALQATTANTASTAINATNATNATNAANLSGNINPSQINASGASSAQVLKWNGTAWAPAADDWGTQSAVTDATLAGNGTSGTPLKIAQNGATSGQSLKWNGSAWVPSTSDWGTQSVVTDATLAGNGTSGNALKLAQNSATTGQFLRWSGSAWAPANVFAGTNNTIPKYTSGSTLGNSLITDNGTTASFNGKLDITQASGAMNFLDPLGIITFPAVSSGTPGPMIQMFASGTSNVDRMVIGHSPSYPNYGLMYSDATDVWHWVSAGAKNITMDPNQGYIGLSTTAPNAPLQLSNSLVNRKIVLWEGANNDHQFFGFGVTANTLRYQINNSSVDAHVFYAGTSSSTSTELMRIGGNGNVGIGISTPVAPLTINNTSNAYTLYQAGSGSGNSSTDGMYVGNNSTLTGYIWNYENAALQFGTNSAERMRILSSGEVGIGISTPGTKLHVSEGSSTAYALPSPFAFTSQNSSTFVKTAGGSTNTAVLGACTGSATYNIGVTGLAQAGTNAYGFYGSASGGSSSNYGVYCNGSGGYTGTWTTLSDMKFKSDFLQIESALGKIMQLNPTTYMFKTNEYKYMNFPTFRQFGFIAQELETVFPTLVEKGAHPGNGTDGAVDYKGVNYIGLIPVLTKAIQEQQLIIDQMKKEIAELKANK